MKKILLASSVLALSASAVMAEVAVSGDGRFGVYDTGAVTRIEGRTRVNFGLSASGDHGLTFGGTMRLATTYTGGVAAAGTVTNGSVFIGANGFRLTYGDIDGAVANRVAIYGGGLGFTGRVGRPATHAFNTTYLEGDTGATASVRVDYTTGGFGISIADRAGVANRGEIAVSYSASGLNAAAGYSETGAWSISAGYAMGAYSLGLLHTDLGATSGTRVWGTYAMGATTLRATISRIAGVSSYGIGASYSLGGGAAFHAAAAREGAATTGQIGVTFSF